MRLKPKVRWLLLAIIISLIFISPYLLHEVSYEHDTFFHLSRIEGLAKALSHHDFFPSIYFDKNDLYGYASALFYSDFFILPFSLLYLLGFPLMACYKLTLFTYTLIGNLCCIYLVTKFTHKDRLVLLAMILFTFATYRLTNVYVRGALQEVISYSFMPLVMAGIYDFIQQRKWMVLSIGFVCLILSHNITFILSCYLFGALLLMNLSQLSKYHSIALLKAIFVCVGLTSFFTFGMLEQLLDQSFNLNVDNSINLQTSSLHIYQYLQNTLNFNLSIQDFTGMIVNPGLGLLLFPLSFFLVLDHSKDNKHRFIFQLMILGYFLLILQSSAINLSVFKIFNFMQFTWRLNNVVCILLLLPSCIYLDEWLDSKPILMDFIVCLLIVNSLWLLSKPLERTNILENDITYQQIIHGDVIDPYYAAYYKRVELAGGDYLPQIYYDYKTQPYGIYTPSNQLVTQPINTYDQLYFELNVLQKTIILPKTYYKGYQLKDDQGTLYTTYLDSKTGLVAVDIDGATGNFTLYYQHTFIQQLGGCMSLLSLIILIVYQTKKQWVH